MVGKLIKLNNDLRIWLHWTNALPVKPGGQLHIGLWLTTWHLAPIPHVPGQGSRHFWLLQALLKTQSELTIHSGWQVGGEPVNPTIHEQTACWYISRQILFGPHGDGLQGSCTTATNN